MSKFFYVLSLTFIGAVIVHICVLFLVPHYASSHIADRLRARQAAESEERTGYFIRLAKDDPLVIRLDPAFRLLACHFDLADGPVRLTVPDTVPFWSLSLHTKEGENIYSINNRVAATETLDLIIGDPVQMMEYKKHAGEGGDDSLLTEHAIKEGFVILRAFSPSAAWDSHIEAFLQSARCTGAM